MEIKKFNGEDILDPYNSQQRFDNWSKEKQIKGVNSHNSELIIKFIQDLSIGINVTGTKGARSPKRLNTLRDRLSFIFRELEKRNIKDIRKAKPEQLHQFFNDMRTGVVKNRFGLPYKSTGDYIKCFKTFWHWLQKTNKNKFDDVTTDLDTRGEKPKFVYITDEDCNEIIERASFDLKPVLSLAFDSGMRVTEMINTRVIDFSNDFQELNIRDEVSKTFGRKIKLMLCSKQIKEYIKKVGLKPDDFLIKLSPAMINRELRKIGKDVLTPEQIRFKNLSLYDFRHSSACYWLPKYKSESALKYRFGWKKSDMIHYYTELKGMKDTITQDDLFSEVTKTELEKGMATLQKENDELKTMFLELTNKVNDLRKLKKK